MAAPVEWIVAWGRPGRRDWHTVKVLAYEADEALAAAREAHPHLPPPQYAFLADGDPPADARALDQ